MTDLGWTDRSTLRWFGDPKLGAQLLCERHGDGWRVVGARDTCTCGITTAIWCPVHRPTVIKR